VSVSCYTISSSFLRSSEAVGLTTVSLHFSLEKSIRDNLKFVRESPLITERLKSGCVGLIFDLKSGKLTRVDE
jgi:carbonic anhydrase